MKNVPEKITAVHWKGGLYAVTDYVNKEYAGDAYAALLDITPNDMENKISPYLMQCFMYLALIQLIQTKK